MMYLLAQDMASPDDFVPIMALPVGFTVLACVIFYFGWRVQNRLMKAPWKWAGIPFVVYAMYVGITYVIKYQDPFYQAQIGAGKKMAIAHYGSFIIPLLGLAGIILFHFFNHKLNLATDDD